MSSTEDVYETADPLVAFLYELTRDYVPPGRISKIIKEQNGHDGWALSDIDIANMAKRWADMLREQSLVKTNRDCTEVEKKHSRVQKDILKQRDEFRKRMAQLDSGVLDL